MSVILPVYNQAPYIAETIESVLGQSFKNFEFIIWDDGSTDQSAEIIKCYAKNDNRIRAYFEKNSGKSIATNKIVEFAEANLCAFLDADDVMLPDRLQYQIKFHQDNPGIHASSGHCYYINEKGNYELNQAGRNIRVYNRLDIHLMFDDFFSKLAIFNGKQSS